LIEQQKQQVQHAIVGLVAFVVQHMTRLPLFPAVDDIDRQ